MGLFQVTKSRRIFHAAVKYFPALGSALAELSTASRLGAGYADGLRLNVLAFGVIAADVKAPNRPSFITSLASRHWGQISSRMISVSSVLRYCL
jgi:hypothetical protein